MLACQTGPQNPQTSKRTKTFMVKKLFSLLLGLVLVACLSTIALAQADTAAKDAKDDKKEAKAPAEKKARWEGIVVRSNKEKSTLTVRKRGTAQERTVE